MKRAMMNFKRIVSCAVSFCFILQQACFAQNLAQLDFSRYLANAQRPVAGIEKVHPFLLRYFSFNFPEETFHLFLDKGDRRDIKDATLKEETKTLFNYFLIGITLPNDTFWVNLRPDAENQIIDPLLARTDIGKIMLEADLQLKKDTAMALSPNTPQGRQYWDKLYKKAEEIFGAEKMSIPTLTRPWIVPGEVIVRYSDDSAYIYKSTLKVMLEQDYLKDSSAYKFDDARLKALNDYSAQLMRELIIPGLTKQINTSQNYAALRQVFYSLILAQCFKLKFNNNKMSMYGARVNSKNLTGLTSKENWDKSNYFNAYKTSFANGEFNIKERVAGSSGQTIRTYFSGGADLGGVPASAYGPATVSGATIEGGLAEAGLPGMRVGSDGDVTTLPPPGSRAFEGGPNHPFTRVINEAFQAPQKYPYAALSEPLVPKDKRDLLRYPQNRTPEKLRELMAPLIKLVEDNFMLVQPGVPYKGGDAQTGRTASGINKMWTDILEYEDPIGLPEVWIQAALTQEGMDALMAGDISTYVDKLIRYVQARQNVERRWILLAIDYHEGDARTRKQLPWYARNFADRMFSGTDKDFDMVRDTYLKEEAKGKGNGRRYFEQNSLYTKDDIGTLVTEGIKEGVAIFPLGAGGPGAMCIAVSKKGKEHLVAFLQQHDVGEMDREEATKIVRGEGVYATTEVKLKGYLDFEVGEEPLQVRGFDILNATETLQKLGITIKPPEPPKWATLNMETGEVDLLEENEVVLDPNLRIGLATIARHDFKQGKSIFEEDNKQWLGGRLAEAKKRGFSSEVIRQAIQEAIDAGKIENDAGLEIEMHLRGVDGTGSSLDLPLWQVKLTEEGKIIVDVAVPQEILAQVLPSTPTFASAFTVVFNVGLAKDAKTIEYIAPDFKIFESDPSIAEGVEWVDHPNAAKHAAGVRMARNRQKDAAVLIFKELFGLSGFRVYCKSIEGVARAGGMESSNVANVALVALASMLSGADLNEAEVFNLAVKLENDELDGLTGGQGHLNALRGGAWWHWWLTGVRDPNGKRNFGAYRLDTEGKGFSQPEDFTLIRQSPTGVKREIRVPRYRQASYSISTLNYVYRTLDGETQELLKGLTVIILDMQGVGTGHYSLGRPQIYIDESLLESGQERRLAMRLYHEAHERQDVLDALAALGLRQYVVDTELNPNQRLVMEVDVPNVGRRMLSNVIDELTTIAHNRLQTGRDIDIAQQFVIKANPGIAYIYTNIAPHCNFGAQPVQYQLIQNAAMIIARILADYSLDKQRPTQERKYVGDNEPWATIGQELKKLDTGLATPVFAQLAKDLPFIMRSGTMPASMIDQVTAPGARSVGGIDFRYISLMTQFQASNFKADFQMPKLADLNRIDLELEKGELNRMISQGIIPSSERVTGYIAACYLKNGAEDGMTEAVVCLSKLFRLEEDMTVESDQRLKSFLYFIESSSL